MLREALLQVHSPDHVAVFFRESCAIGGLPPTLRKEREGWGTLGDMKHVGTAALGCPAERSSASFAVCKNLSSFARLDR